MALHLHSPIKTDYPFLAHPPPQKKRPLQPSQTSIESSCIHRRGSSTVSAIAAWAAHVQPGSPASLSPRSPHRRSSLRKGRAPSIASIQVPFTSFLHIAPTPTVAHLTTPSISDFKADLTTVGYTPVFLRLDTPISAKLSLAIKSPPPNAAKNIPIPSPISKPRGFTRFRSLSVLRSRGRTKSTRPEPPTKMKAQATAASAAIIKRKKAKYAYTVRPPPFASELALMQFADGGSMDDNIQRAMATQAKAAGGVCLADVYRDAKGDIWWDQDEEWEYAHLLSEGDHSRPHATGGQWVTFGGNTSPSTASVPGEERRGSVSTQDSDLDLNRLVRPADFLNGNDVALLNCPVAPLSKHKPTASVLSLPSRPPRDTKHVQKPDFLVNAEFSWLHAPKSPQSPTSAGTDEGTSRPKGKARRRPAPLKLFPPSPASKQPTNSPIDADKVRKGFIEGSFEPVVSVPVTPTTAVSPTGIRARVLGSSRTINAPWRTVNVGPKSLGMKTKSSRLNMIGLFRSARKEDVAR